MSKFLEDIREFIVKNNYNVYSISEIKDGGEVDSIRVVYGNECQDSYSVAKAFVVTAIGILYDRGMLKTDSKAVELLGDECPTGIDDRWNRITLHMLLTHTAGLPKSCLDIDSIDCRQYGSDYLTALMHLPFAYEPGEDRLYSDGAYYLLARIAEKLTGENLCTFLWRELFFPLDVREAAWSCCPQGHCMGATGLYIRSSDMVKLGQVYLEGGTYRGRRIISREWVDRVLSAPYEMAPKGFGNIYGKGGMHRQLLFVDPDCNRVVAFHSYGSTDLNEMMRFTAEYGRAERLSETK